jgi:hypothetical protein
MKYLLFIVCNLVWTIALAQQGGVFNYLTLNPNSLPSKCGSGTLRFSSGSSTLNLCYPANTWTAVGSGGGGGVSSVALADGSSTAIYSITGSPVTGSGTLTFSAKNQSANTVFAGPSSGGATDPTFRSLVAADIPTTLNTTTESSLTTVGTIGTGIWQGTKISSTYGGTGINSGSSTGVPFISSGAWGVDTTLPNTLGGTGQGSNFNQYGACYAPTTTTLGTTSAGTANYPLVANSSAAPTFQLLPIAGGGTGAAISATQWGVPYFSATTTMASTAAGTLGNPLISGATGAPSFSATPTIANIIDTSNVLNIEDSTTNSKVLAFNASNNSASTTLTLEPTQTTSQILKFPNITAGDSVATLGLAQTFANAQTFTSAPVFSSVTASQALTVNGSKALTSNAFSSSPAASTIAEWDANKNMSFDSYIPAGTSTATAAGTTALLVGSNYYQFFTGSTTQTVTLPVVTGLAQGQGFEIFNLSTGVVTVESSGANVIQAMAANTVLKLVCINTSGGTGTASWSWMYESAQGSLPAGFSGLNTNGIIYATSGTAVSSTAVGSSGSVLTSNGAGVAPTFQAAATSVTGSYFSGSTVNSPTVGWVYSTTALADPSTTSTNTLTTRKSSGITVTAAAGSLPGIVFTPGSSSQVFQITASFTYGGVASSGDDPSFSLTDGTTIISTRDSQPGAVSSFPSMTLTGIYAPANTSANTIKIQGAVNAGTIAIISAGSIVPSIEWTVIRIF